MVLLIYSSNSQDSDGSGDACVCDGVETCGLYYTMVQCCSRYTDDGGNNSDECRIKSSVQTEN